MNKLEDRLLEKSKEAFIMAIELYNKHTIKYRVEVFSLFICNAWELMLKAHLLKVKGPQSIYFPDNPNRTISLENAIKEIFTNNKDPLRLNLEKIIELRNTSTHFITEEYEMVYVPLFQSCILNFNEKMFKFHSIDMTEIIPQNFLTLSVSMHALNEAEIIAKYPEEIATKLITVNDSITELSATNNHAFSIKIDHRHFLTKNRDEATSIVHVDKNAEAGVKIIKEMKDPNDTHKYNVKACNAEINKRLRKLGIPLEFNNYHFGLFSKYFGLKQNPKFCYEFRVNATPTYSYSMQTIDFIVEEIKKDPEHIIQNLKEKLTKNKLTPGAKEF